MAIEIGTRSRNNVAHQRPPQGSNTRGYTRDLKMLKNVTASCTFVNSTTKQVQASNGTFTAFAVGDLLLIQGTNLNNGNFQVTGVDATNQAYLVLDPSPKNEGPITATIRTN